MKVEVMHYTKVLETATILQDVTYTFESGKIYGLQGRNGSGKTMLLRAICGLITPTEGCVRVDGKEIGKDLSFPESIGVLIENPGFINNYTAMQNLKTIASIRSRITSQQIEDVLTAVGLDPKDSRKYRKFSLGMKQRLGIAAAVMEDPEIILLDEPTNALDSAGMDMVQCLLNAHKSRGALILVASHDKEVLDQLADEILFVDNGKVMPNISHREGVQNEKQE